MGSHVFFTYDADKSRGLGRDRLGKIALVFLALWVGEVRVTAWEKGGRDVAVRWRVKGWS